MGEERVGDFEDQVQADGKKFKEGGQNSCKTFGTMKIGNRLQP